MDSLILSFGGITVRSITSILFSDLCFDIHEGEQWALVGPSGSGKTALLETIAGKYHISKGEVNYPFFNRYITRCAIADPLFNRQKLIAQVSSRHHFRNLSNTSSFYYQQRFNSADSEDVETVEQYLHSIKSNTPVVWTYSRVTERLRLTPLLDKQLIKLSNGETKRLLFAAALLKNPVLLLLDSPFTGLDAESRKDLNYLLSEIADSGIHIVMATPPGEIPDVITNVAILQDRKVIKAEQKKYFDAAQASYPETAQIDADELNRLLAIHVAQTHKTLLEMKDIVIRYGDKLILDHVNWVVASGERWALLGPNGAGKSTLLSLVNGDNPQAYANDIILFDRKRGSGESIWDIKKKIGFVSPELFQYFPVSSSCLQVIESGFYDTLGLFRPSDPFKASISKRWMELLEIDASAQKQFRNVSASVQRLCLLCRALVKNPPLLIFDEPCQGLDPHQQEHFKKVVDEICKYSNVGLIYVTHYPHEIPESVNHTLKLNDGKVVA